MDDERPSRRAADGRLAELDKNVAELTREVRSIREMLITEPEASPLGRSLLKASERNRQLIESHHAEFRQFVRDDFAPLDDWWNQSKGAWKFVLGLSTVLGIIGAFFGLVSYFGPR